MKGQIFILGAMGIVLALFMIIPTIQKEIYLPNTDNSMLKNIAGEYNYWIAYSSIGGSSEILDFGTFVKENYPNMEFFYVYTEGNNLKVANFFDEEMGFSVNGDNFSIKSNQSIETSFSSELDFSSDYRNFKYIPENEFSGAIFLRVDKGIARIQLLEIFE
ncbi:MAG: hypothetical protein DRP06_04525 [Candidatus Aenigmatarchaeota archaeon]|nr:MAG: hypothetical protein DRP06_04525 [Candidatus Aenigmarchaeota archaeon]